MKKVQIITDSCSDLGKAIRQEKNIAYCKMNIVMDGAEKPASLDWDTYSPKELYDFMRDGKRVTTTQVPAKEFLSVFTEYLEKDFDIVYIGCATPLSGSVNTATVVAKQLLEKYPDNKIIAIDAINSCLGEGLLAVRAAGLRDEGKSAEEIAAVIEKEKIYVNQYATVDTLDCLKKAGRVKASSAFFGNLFGVKPIIISDKNGQNVAVKKVKGRKASIDEMVAMLKEIITEPEKQTLYIGHADAPEDADYMLEKVKAEIPCKDVYVNYIGPIIGASIGPGALVLYGCGKAVEIEG